MPTLRQLEYLVALADTGHVGRAAERLGVTQPTLSAQLAELERKLGVVLAERGRSGAMLTAIGRETALRARDILRAVEELKDHAAGARPALRARCGWACCRPSAPICCRWSCRRCTPDTRTCAFMCARIFPDRWNRVSWMAGSICW